MAVASKHVRDHPPAPRELNPSIPPTFEAIILKAMAKDPAHRYATAEELRADLLRFNEGRSVLAMDEAATGATAVAGGTGATQAVGAVDPERTRAVAATPADAADERPRRVAPTGPAPTPSSWSSCCCSCIGGGLPAGAEPRLSGWSGLVQPAQCGRASRWPKPPPPSGTTD